MGHNGTLWNYSVLPSTNSRHETEISYETGYNLYPITVTQKGDPNSSADDLVTHFQVYGFNGAALDGWQKQTGLLKQVTNPNGTLVIYEYDPFGRLFAAYENQNDRGNIEQVLDGDPLVRYRYWDNGWNQAQWVGGELKPIVYLNPAENDPFMITTQTRPGSFNPTTPGYEFRQRTFFDGLGRPIQSHNSYQEVHEGGSLSYKDVITRSRYNGQGQVDCQTVPYTAALYNSFPANPYLPGACTSYSHTATTYDTLGRPLTVTTPGGTTATYAYAITSGTTAGNHDRLAITRIQDGNDHLVRHYHNVWGQLALVREYTGSYPNETAYADTRYFYNTPGQLTHVGTSDPSNTPVSTWLRLNEITYDAVGRKLSLNDPDMGEWNYGYDALSNLAWQTDALGERLCFTYDPFNRPTHKRHDANNNGCASNDLLLAQTSYYAAGSGGGTGQVQEIKWPDNANKENFSYDSKGRLTSHSCTIAGSSYTMGYGNYDKLNRPTTLTYPSSETVTIGYDHEGENSLVAGSDTLVSAIWYNKQGQMTELFRGNNVRTSYTYAGASGDFRLERAYTRRFVYPITMPHLDFNYSYDDVGNISHIFEDVSNDSQWFTYDELNRLKTAYTSGGPAPYNHAYHYDQLGNLQSRVETVSGLSTEYDLIYPTGSSPARPHAVTEVKIPGKSGNPDTPVYDLTYNNNGNMTERVDHLAGKTYTQEFDVENRLITVTVSSGAPITTTFAYDATGQRTQTVSYNSSTSRTVTRYPFPHYEVEHQQQWQYSCDNDPCDYMWVTTQTTPRTTYFLAGQAIATRVNGTLYFLHSDHLGSTSLMSNSSGYSVSGTTTRYLPYGERRTTPTTTLTERGYTGHHENRDIGLTYMNARYYVPGLGRFLTADTIIPDPTNPQSHNRYTYVLGNPLRYTDPTGHCPAPTPENGYTGSGNVICLAGFIPTQYSQGLFIFLGDNRTFSSNSGTDQSRFWVWIDIDTGKIVNPGGEAYFHPTITNDGKISAPMPRWINRVTVTVFDDGTIRVHYSFMCSHWSCYPGPGPDGWIDFIPDGNGGYTTAGSVEMFPNLEAYLWRNGQLQATLFQHQFFSPAELDSGMGSIGTALGMYGLPRYIWPLPPLIPSPINQNVIGGGGGGSPLNGWDHLLE